MEDHEQTSALQKHVMFFDRNNDGIIYPSETFQGCRAIGVGLLVSSFAAVFVNVNLSRITRPGKSFSFKFPIEVKNIKLAKHTSDTDIYDDQGRFIPERFELVFSQHALTHPHAWTSQELQSMLKSNREPRDYAAWVAAYLEWKVLYYLCKDEQGLLHKQTIRALYDGTLFYKLAEEKASKKKNTTSTSAV